MWVDRWKAGQARRHSIAYSPDGTQLATSGSDGITIKFWNPKTAVEVKKLESHKEPSSWLSRRTPRASDGGPAMENSIFAGYLSRIRRAFRVAGFLDGDLLRKLHRLLPVEFFGPELPMTVLESLQQFVWAGADVLRAIFQLFEPNAGLYLALAVWIVFWTFAVNWVRLRRILLSGGWIGVVLVALMAVLVWGSIAPPPGGDHTMLGMHPSNFFGKMIYVTGLLCIMLICGSVQLAVHPNQEEEPAADPAHTPSHH
jgi:hypothetical protein